MELPIAEEFIVDYWPFPIYRILVILISFLSGVSCKSFTYKIFIFLLLSFSYSAVDRWLDSSNSREHLRHGLFRISLISNL